jgi:hypothetical protein
VLTLLRSLVPGHGPIWALIDGLPEKALEATEEFDLSKARGELLYLVAHELGEIRSELSLAGRRGDFRKQLGRLRWQIVNYMSLCYCMRERLITIMAAICDPAGIQNTFRKKHPPEELRKRLSKHFESVPILIDPVADLLSKINPEIETRNLHIHKTFISVELCIYRETRDQKGKITHEEWIDVREPEDVLIELEGDEDRVAAFNRLLWQSLRQLASQYRTRLDHTRDALASLVHTLESLDWNRNGSFGPRGKLLQFKAHGSNRGRDQDA